MLEERDGMQCVFSFGKDALDAIKNASARGDVEQAMTYTRIGNPLPTGDHWKVIGWVLEHIKRGPSSLAKVANVRRDFIKKAAEEIRSGRGLCLDLGSMAARRFRDQNDLRMQRGKVYILISRLPVRAEESQDVSSGS